MTSDASDDPKPPEAPRLTLAIDEGDLRRKLVAALQRADVSVERVSADALEGTGDALRTAGGDILVLRRRELDDDALRMLRDAAESDDAPAVVILSENESPAQRADLVAAGATKVLDARQPPAELARAFNSLVRSSAVDEDAAAGNDPSLADFLTRSPFMKRFLDLVHRVADSDSSLLITGETGVGKEHLARAIHAESNRNEGPFVAVNCAALPESLIEAELFGHEKGAFTGAERERAGHFEMANGGTIFLDEIGETPQHVQVKLLDVLQRREVQRLGASRPTTVDVRVMAATHRDVEADVRAGTFREDLYYRLNVVPIHVPALRERPEDLPDLVGYLIRHLRESMPGKRAERIHPDAMSALQRYDWPGNVREVINVVERALLLTDAVEIGTEALPRKIASPGALASRERSGESQARRAAPASAESADLPHDWRTLTLKEIRERAIARAERAYLDALLHETSGHVGRTAERAGIGPRALYDRLKRHGLDKDDYKEPTP